MPSHSQLPKRPTTDPFASVSSSDTMSGEDMTLVRRSELIVNAHDASSARLFIERQIEAGSPIASLPGRMRSLWVKWSYFERAILDQLPELVDPRIRSEGPGSYIVDIMEATHPKPDRGCSRKTLWVSVPALADLSLHPDLWACQKSEREALLCVFEKIILSASVPAGPTIRKASL